MQSWRREWTALAEPRWGHVLLWLLLSAVLWWRIDAGFHTYADYGMLVVGYGAGLQESAWAGLSAALGEAALVLQVGQLLVGLGLIGAAPGLTVRPWRRLAAMAVSNLVNVAVVVGLVAVSVLVREHVLGPPASVFISGRFTPLNQAVIRGAIALLAVGLASAALGQGARWALDGLGQVHRWVLGLSWLGIVLAAAVTYDRVWIMWVQSIFGHAEMMPFATSTTIATRVGMGFFWELLVGALATIVATTAVASAMARRIAAMRPAPMSLVPDPLVARAESRGLAPWIRLGGAYGALWALLSLWLWVRILSGGDGRFALGLAMADAAIYVTPVGLVVGLGLVGPLKTTWGFLGVAAVSVLDLIAVSVLIGLAAWRAQGHWPYGVRIPEFFHTSWDAALYGIIATWALGLGWVALGWLGRPVAMTIRRHWQRWTLGLSWTVLGCLLAGLVASPGSTAGWTGWMWFYSVIFWCTKLGLFSLDGTAPPFGVFWRLVAGSVAVMALALTIGRNGGRDPSA